MKIKLSVFSLLLIISIIAYTVIFTGFLTLTKHYCFSAVDTLAVAASNQVVWQTINGKILQHSTLQSNTIETEHIFSVHINPIILLVILVYFFFPHIITWFFFISFFLALGAIPIYLLARDKFKSKLAGFLFSLIYLFYPALNYTNLFIHDVTLAVPFILFAFYFFEKNNFKMFLIFMIMSLLCQETVAMVIFMFGIYGFLSKKPMKFILVPLIVGIGWLYVATEILIPHFAGGKDLVYAFTSYDSGSGGLLGLAKNIIFSPNKTLQKMFTPADIRYLYDIFSPLLYLPLFSLGLIISFPIFLMNLLGPHQFILLNRYHSALLIPGLFIALIFSVKKLSSPFVVNNINKLVKKIVGKKIISEYLRVIVLFSILIVLLVNIILSNISLGPGPRILNAILNPGVYFNPEQKGIFELIDKIPDNASVIAKINYLTQVSQRDYFWPPRRDVVSDNVDYILSTSYIYYDYDETAFNYLIKTFNSYNYELSGMEKNNFLVHSKEENRTITINYGEDENIEIEKLKFIRSAIEKTKRKYLIKTIKDFFERRGIYINQIGYEYSPNLKNGVGENPADWIVPFYNNSSWKIENHGQDNIVEKFNRWEIPYLNSEKIYYTHTSKERSKSDISIYPEMVFKNITYEADILIRSGFPSHYAGLVFNYQNSSNFYIFNLDVGIGEVFLSKKYYDKWHQLGKGKIPIHIRTDVEWINVKIKIIDNNFTGYINGVEAISIVDNDSFSEGNIGLYSDWHNSFKNIYVLKDYDTCLYNISVPRDGSYDIYLITTQSDKDASLSYELGENRYKKEVSDDNAVFAEAGSHYNGYIKLGIFYLSKGNNILKLKSEKINHYRIFVFPSDGSKLKTNDKGNFNYFNDFEIEMYAYEVKNITFGWVRNTIKHPPEYMYDKSVAPAQGKKTGYLIYKIDSKELLIELIIKPTIFIDLDNRINILASPDNSDYELVTSLSDIGFVTQTIDLSDHVKNLETVYIKIELVKGEQSPARMEVPKIGKIKIEGKLLDDQLLT